MKIFFLNIKKQQYLYPTCHTTSTNIVQKKLLAP